MEPNTPELAQLYRCTRFPRHEVFDQSRLTTHTCGEWAPIEHNDLLALYAVAYKPAEANHG